MKKAKMAKKPVRKYKNGGKEEPVKPKVPVTDATKKAATDMAKKAAFEQGRVLAPVGASKTTSGGDMRDAQIALSKEKIEMFKNRYGVYPTPANVKKFGTLEKGTYKKGGVKKATPKMRKGGKKK
jgi:hypothetical protein